MRKHDQGAQRAGHSERVTGPVCGWFFACLWSIACLASPVLGQQPHAKNGQPAFSLNVKSVEGVGGGCGPTGSSELAPNLAAGAVMCDPMMTNCAGGTLAKVASATNYVYLDQSNFCTPASHTTGFTDVAIPMAAVTTNLSSITSVADLRTWFLGGEGTVYNVARFLGPDAEAKTAACVAALPSTGGTCDARALQGAQTWGATLTLTRPVTLLLGNATFTFAGPGPMISIPSEAIGPITIQGVGGYPFNSSLGTILVSNSNDNGITSRMNFNNGPVILRDFSIQTTLGSPTRTQGSAIDIGGPSPFVSCRFVIDGVDASSTELSTSFINGITMSDPIGSTIKDTRTSGILPQMPNPRGVTAVAARNVGGILTPDGINYFYVVSAIDGLGGETTTSGEAPSAARAGNSVNISWTAVRGAAGYKIYGRTRLDEQFIAQVGAGVTTYSDLGRIAPSGLPLVSNTTVGGDGFHLNRGTSTSFINTYGINSGRNNYRILGGGYISFEGTASDNANGDSYYLYDVSATMISPGAENTHNGHGIYIGGGLPFFLIGSSITNNTLWSEVSVWSPAVFGDGREGRNGIQVEGNSWVVIGGGTAEGTKSYDSRISAEGIPQVTMLSPRNRPLGGQPLVPDTSALPNPGSYTPGVFEGMFSLGRVQKLGQLRPPAFLTATSAAGGALPAGNYRFQVTSLDVAGHETTPSAVAAAVVRASGKATLTWTDTKLPVAATSFSVYTDNATGGVPQKIATVGGDTFTFTLSASPTLGAAAPLTNTTASNTPAPSVALGNVFLTNNTSPTTITNFLMERVGTIQPIWLPGQMIVIRATDTNTTIQGDGPNIFLRGHANKKLALDETITLIQTAAAVSNNSARWDELSAAVSAVPTTYNTAGAFQAGAHVVEDKVALVSGTATVILAPPASFASASSYRCTANDNTTVNQAVKIAQNSGTSVTFSATGTDLVSFVCVGN